MRLASDPLALAAQLPDVPRWVETRDLLSSGDGAMSVNEDATGAVVVDGLVDTFEEHRRRGYAAACFRALAAHMAARGRQPVWAAADHNRASLELAAKLGFQPVDRIALLTPAG